MTNFMPFIGSAIKKIKFPLPPLKIQQAIVAEIEAEQALVTANRKLVERIQGKLEIVIGQVWDNKVKGMLDTN